MYLLIHKKLFDKERNVLPANDFVLSAISIHATMYNSALALIMFMYSRKKIYRLYASIYLLNSV